MVMRGNRTYFKRILKATGSTSGILISSVLSAMSPYSIAKNTELPVARMYLCAGIRVSDPIKMLQDGPTFVMIYDTEPNFISEWCQEIRLIAEDRNILGDKIVPFV